MTDYLLRGEADDGTIVEITVTGTQARERKRGHLEGQGYDVQVAAVEEPDEDEPAETPTTPWLEALVATILAAAVLVAVVTLAGYVMGR